MSGCSTSWAALVLCMTERVDPVHAVIGVIIVVTHTVCFKIKHVTGTHASQISCSYSMQL